jgi:hypothetical protein
MAKPQVSNEQQNVKGAVSMANGANAFNPVDYLASGYPKVSGYIERMPEVGIFRRFGALSARFLFYCQAEIIELEEELIKIEKEDEASNHEMRMKYSVDYAWLKASEGEQDIAVQKQWKLVQQIMPKLKEYGELPIPTIQVLQRCGG